MAAKKPKTISADDDQQIRIPKPIAQKLRVLAAHHGMTMPKYLAKVLGGIVDEQFAKMVTELASGRT